MDAHYTPSWIADAVIDGLEDAIDESSTMRIVDPAVGTGALLEAAAKRWPDATLAGTDIDPQVVASLRLRHPSWHLGRCDVLAQRSRRASPVLRSPADAVILNPPFSGRGAAAVRQTAFDCDVRSSQAMAFVLIGVDLLAKGAVLAAVVPWNLLHSEKDASARELLAAYATVELLEDFGSRSFPGVVARTVLIRCKRNDMVQAKSGALGRAVPQSRRVNERVRLVRGTVPMHRSRVHTGLPLVHTKHLVGGKVIQSGLVAATTRPVSGPAVLLPRVGAPSPLKVTYLPKGRTVALSDCVFALVAQTPAVAKGVQDTIVRNWWRIETRYIGSCAPYLTQAALAEQLAALGIGVVEGMPLLEPGAP